MYIYIKIYLIDSKSFFFFPFFVFLNTVDPTSYFHHLDNTSVTHKSEAYFGSKATKVGEI